MYIEQSKIKNRSWTRIHEENKSTNPKTSIHIPITIIKQNTYPKVAKKNKKGKNPEFPKTRILKELKITIPKKHLKIQIHKH